MKRIITAILVFVAANTFAQDFNFGKISKEELEEQFYPLDSTAEAAYLYRKKKIYFDYTQDGFEIKTDVHLRIKIYTKEGFNKATQYISYYAPDRGKKDQVNSIKAYTYNLENGKISKEKLSKKSIFNEKKSKYWSLKKIAMPNIKIGSVLELKYSTSSVYHTNIEDLQFQHDIPVKKLDYNVDIPEYFSFNKRIKGYYHIIPKTVKKNRSFQWRSARTMTNQIGGFQRQGGENLKVNYISQNTSFNATSIPSLKDNEPFVSDIKNYRGGVKFELAYIDFTSIQGRYKQYTTTWENVSKQIFKSSSFGEELNKTNYFKNDLPSVISSVANNYERIAAIFQFVKSKVKWNGYYNKYTDFGVKKAYKEGTGNVADINLMLTAMLREAGLNANPVLVSSRDNGVPLFPTLDGYNYVVSSVELPEGIILLDATEPFSTPNILPIRTLNWEGRIVKKNGNSKTINLSPLEHHIEDNNVIAKITDDLTIEGMFKSKHENHAALTHRKTYNHLKEEEIISKVEEKYNIEIDKFKINSKNEIAKPISQLIKFTSEDLIETISDKVYINPLLFLASTKNPFKLKTREFPIDFATPWKDKNATSIQIPEGYKVESIPETLAIALPDNLGVFKFQSTQTGNKIKTQTVLQFNSSLITPQYYGVLKEFYAKVVAKQAEKIVLIKI